MLPNLAPLLFVFVVMGTTGIDLDMATVPIASVVLGITVDDTIHFFHSYLERRHKGLGVVFSLARSFEASGRAVVAISLLLVAQFLLLAGSRFQPPSHFGLCMDRTHGGRVYGDMVDTCGCMDPSNHLE